MGGLLAFRVGNFDNTAEREQFRFLCERLKTHYENSNDFCVFVGNYNIGCELDALFIKKDAIIAIEFKNYGGKVIANENGEWTCDGKVIKGGSRKTVLQQARVNHSIVKKELKVLGVENNQIKDVPTLVIFHQPIELDNRLSATNKSWLHITDDAHFLEKLDDITCPKTDLSPLDIVNLAELLNLNSYYLTEFSNANYDKEKNIDREIDIFEDIKTSTNVCSADAVEDEMQLSQNLDCVTKEFAEETILLNSESDCSKNLIRLKEYAENIVLVVCGKNKYELKTFTCNDFISRYPLLSKKINREFVVVVEGDVKSSEKVHLEKFLKEEIIDVSSNMFFWQAGDTVKNDITHVDRIPNEENTNDDIIQLPDWLDSFIFKGLKAKYSPDHIKYEYNLELTKEEVLVYLGTYFPRSYSEAVYLFSKLCLENNYDSLLKQKETLNLLDLGCGTGGEIFGVLEFIDRKLPKLKTVNILAIDGNHQALRVFERVMEEYKRYSRFHISYKIGPVFVNSISDLNEISDIVSDKYDIILTFKAICELLAKGRMGAKAYKETAGILSSKLADEGILLIEDVTVKSALKNEFLPKIMNAELNEFIREQPEYSTLYPVCCRQKDRDCVHGCFLKDEVKVRHTKRDIDVSKITSRFICHRSLLNILKVS